MEASVPGELVSLDTFYVGKLKGVGKIWQYTACDAACSFGLARLSTELSSEQAGAFLGEVVMPFHAGYGLSLQRVLTDGGSEFKAAFSKLSVDASRLSTPMRSWTSRFVRARRDGLRGRAAEAQTRTVRRQEGFWSGSTAGTSDERRGHEREP